MGNTSDFILKNAIEVGADTKVTLGTITSGTVDLSTGNYFAETLAGNTTYVFSNPGDVQSFQMEITGGAVANGYDLSVASYDSKTLTVSTNTPDAAALAFNNDGTKLYVGGATEIDQYTLSTAWDISTGTYDSVSLTLANGPATGMFISPDGTKLYHTAFTDDTVYQYTMSTAFDLSTASYDSISFSVQTQAPQLRDVTFKPDGTKMYVTCYSTDDAYQYSLSTAWDISTASYDSVSYPYTGMGIGQAISFNGDGTILFVLDDNNAAGGQVDVTPITLSTAWDLSSATGEGTPFSLTSQTTSADSMAFSSDGTKMYVLDDALNRIYQYTTGTITDATISWPTNVEWPSGVTPFAPAVGETDVYTFVTDASGTTYIGLHTADNLS